MKMSDSDHHHTTARRVADSPQPLFPAPDPLAGATILGPTHTAQKLYHARHATRIIHHDALHTVYEISAALHDVTLLAPAHTVCLLHEDILLRMASDLRTLGNWVQTAHSALRKSQRATSAHPARPSPEAPATPRHTPLPPSRLPRPSHSRSTPPTPSHPAIPDNPPVMQPGASPAAPATPPVTLTAPVSTTPSAPTPAAAVAPSTLIEVTPDTLGPHTRIVIKYGKALRKNRPDAAKIIKTLNYALGNRCVSSIGYEHGDSLALYLHRGIVADDVMSRMDIILDSLRTLFPSDPGMAVERNEPWHKVVLHSVPIPAWTNDSTLEKQLAFLTTDLCKSNNLSADSIRLLRPLCRDAERLFRSTDKSDWLKTVSLLLCLADEADATRLRRQCAISQSTTIRVSDYRPRDGTPVD